MSNPESAKSKAQQLAEKARQAKLVSIYKWPCDGVARCAIAGKSELGLVTYAVAYNIIFHDSGGRLEKERRMHSRESVRRLKLLNAFYLSKAGGWVNKQVRHNLGVVMLASAMSQKPETEHDHAEKTRTETSSESDEGRAASG